MTLERFSEIWDSIDWPVIKDPIMVDGCSEHTIDALVAASDGDFKVFDGIQQKLDEYDRRGS